MKTRIAILSILSVLGSLLQVNAHAVDDRVFYYSKEDVINPDGVNSFFDLTSIQVALTSDGYIQFYLLPLSGVDPDKIVAGTVYGVLINADGKVGNDIVLSTAEVEYYGSSKSSVKVFDVKTTDGGEISNCNASSWITSNEDAVAFELLASCIKAPKEASAIGIASDGIATDFAPEVDEEFKFNTNYIRLKIIVVKMFRPLTG